MRTLQFIILFLLFLTTPVVAQNNSIKKILYVSMILEGPGPDGRQEAKTIDEACKRSVLFDKFISDIALAGFRELWNYDFYVQGRVIGGGISDDRVEFSIYELFPDTRTKRLIECSREFGYSITESSDVQSWIDNVMRDIQSLKTQGKMREYVYVKHSVTVQMASLKETLDELPKRLNRDQSLKLVTYFLRGENTEYAYVKMSMTNDMTKLSVSLKKADSDRVKRKIVPYTDDEIEISDKVFNLILSDFKR